jgi:hypothetical protein
MSDETKALTWYLACGSNMNRGIFACIGRTPATTADLTDRLWSAEALARLHRFEVIASFAQKKKVISAAFASTVALHESTSSTRNATAGLSSKKISGGRCDPPLCYTHC